MAAGPWLDETEQRAWRSLLGAYRRLMARLDAELEASQQLTLADYGVLAQLSEAPEGRLRMSELAELSHLSPSGLTRRLDNLVKAGLVRRTRCATDRRGSYAVLTKAGHARLARAAPDHAEQVRRHFVERLTRRQLVALADALELVAGCEAAGAAALEGHRGRTRPRAGRAP